MNYDEAINWLGMAGNRKKLYPIYLRPERMALLLKFLNIDPSHPSVHIAGTSGKGSTSQLAASVLESAGYRVGLHTTPHLQTPRERMQVNGKLPSEIEFAALATKVINAAIHLEETNSYGAYNGQELLFTIAALHFKQNKVDISVVETFMGGQYDPTNIINPLVSVITNVDLDHTKLLGKTVESIAMVKAGVIKKETPCIIGATQKSVINIFTKRAADLQTPCIVLGKENQFQARLLGLKGSLLSVKVLDTIFANLHVGLLGRHQANNAVLVLYIVQVLRSRGWLISDQSIRDGFSQAFIPGRLEIVQQDPMIVLDGAHNPAKTKALASALKKLFPGRPITFVFAMKRGKNLEESLKPLLPLTHQMIVTRFSEKKSRSTAYINQYLKSKEIKVITRLDPNQALEFAQKHLPPHGIICVTGSLYLIGMLRNNWYPELKKPSDHFKSETAWVSAVGEPIRQSEIK